MNGLENNIILALKEIENPPKIGRNISWAIQSGMIILYKDFLQLSKGKYFKDIMPMNQNLVRSVVEIISAFVINYKNQLSK